MLSNADSGSGFKFGGSISLIEKAFKDGSITRADKIFYNLQAVLAPNDLPANFRAPITELIPCGTPYVMEAQNNWKILSSDQQAIAANYLARPTSDAEYISSDSLFMVHYDTTGYEAVPLEDLNLNSIPDYVERIAIYADSSYRYYHQDLGYLPHPFDADSLYDIYLIKLSAYGVTVRETQGDSAWNDYTSYIQVHNSFFGFPSNDDPEGDVIGAQKVTCAHEYYHATQLAYDGTEEVWWMECTATCFEEVTFPEVNDNYWYLNSFFDYPDTSLITGGYHMYGAFIWPIYLWEKYGINILRSVWEYCRYSNSLASIDSALLPFGKSLKLDFPEFASWNYFTGSRNDGGRYDSGAYYPTVPFDRVVSSLPFTAINALNPPDGLSCNYIMAYPGGAQNGYLKLDFDGINSVEWAFAYIGLGQSGSIFGTCPVDILGRTTGGIYNFLKYDSIVFIPTIVSQWLDDNQYSFATIFIPFGDASGSGATNIQDITYLINYLYKGGPPPLNDMKLGDNNCSGIINIQDITYLINFLYKGGVSPCVIQ
jgi:hypothetical protein